MDCLVNFAFRTSFRPFYEYHANTIILTRYIAKTADHKHYRELSPTLRLFRPAIKTCAFVGIHACLPDTLYILRSTLELSEKLEQTFYSQEAWRSYAPLQEHEVLFVSPQFTLHCTLTYTTTILYSVEYTRQR